jgi:hypothetical protein
MLLQSMNQEGGEEKPSAPPPSPRKQRDDSEGAWPWFLGNIEDLAWFRQACEMHVRRFHHGMTPEVLVGGHEEVLRAPRDRPNDRAGPRPRGGVADNGVLLQ